MFYRCFLQTLIQQNKGSSLPCLTGAGIKDNQEKSAAKAPPLLLSHFWLFHTIAKNFRLKLARAIITFDDVELVYGTASRDACWQLDEPWGRQLCALDVVCRSERWAWFNAEP